MSLIGNSNLIFIRAEEEDKVEIFMTHIIMIEEITKIDIGQIVMIEDINIQNRGRLMHEQNYRRGNSRGNVRSYQDFGRQNRRREYRVNYRNKSYSRE